MFEEFRRNFIEDAQGWQSGGPSARILDPDLKYFFDVLGGKSFNGGLYRTVHPADLRFWHERLQLAFPGYERKTVCFGYDWLGRAFGVAWEREEEGRPDVLMFDIGSGEVFEIPANLITFHDSEIIKSTEPALAVSLYEAWRASGGAAPDYDKCIGHRVPLFLGGEEAVGNLEACDLDVYWSIFGQVLQQVGPAEEEE
jgi:hypothetical protein